MSDALPTASGGFGDKPTLAFPGTPAPPELSVRVLVQGTGRTVEAGDEIEVNYYGQIWSGAMFDNSYDRRSAVSFPIGIGAVIGGWDDGLVGRQVGSRVMLSIPPHLGYGERGMPQAGIGGTDTLVFVVDILGCRQG
jgi:peptidylprolyl isomerase